MEESRKKPEKDTERPGEIQREKRVTKKKKEGWKMGEMTIKDIARKCGVGPSTVSRAINNHPNINPETRERVLSVIRETGFVPNNSARNLKRIEANCIAVLIKGITNPNRSNPSTNMIERIEKSIYKMMTAAVILDQTEDYSKYTELVIEKKYIGNVLAAERKMATINGQLVADALHLYREPILMEFARVRGQLSRVPKEVIENTKRQTDNNIAIETYLMQRIARMKDPKAKAIKKIRYDAIFKDAELVGKQQQRAMSTIFEYLDHYKKVGWIEGYSRIKEGVQILT